jgi:hypothetical protein
MAAEYQKVSISMPIETIERLKERAGPRGVSAYVTEAVQSQLQLDGLDDLIAWMEEKNGPVDVALVREIEDRYFS